ncbi:MAG TPA: ArsC/Spx/MgsR family protein [Nocardioidaceae bacterium]|nr:ArsC/Spx/MgsR family protein [Nocardioidaceae bacterium]
MEIWINPACSKCRAAASALDEAGIEYTERRYLDEPPTPQELTEVLNRLGLEPWDIVRMKEKVAGEIGLRDIPRNAENRDRWISVMVEHPILIQRPIITADDGTTVVGRDPDSVGRVIDAEG